MLRLKYVFAIFICICSSIISFGQNNNVVFKKLTSLEGLSQNDVNAIYQDLNGFIWIGTNDGLNRYDGYRFSTFGTKSNEPQLSSQLINCINGDKKGKLYIGTTNNGLNIIDLKKNTVLQCNELFTDKNHMLSGIIRGIEVSSTGIIWVSTNSGFAMVSNLENNDIITYNTSNNQGIKSIEHNDIKLDDEDNLWVATGAGLYCLKAPHYTKPELVFIPKGEGKSIGLSLHSKAIAYSCKDGVYVLEPKSENPKVVLVTSTPSNRLFLDSQQNLWRSNTTSLFKQQLDDNLQILKTDQFKKGNPVNMVNNNTTNCYHEDNLGQVWIGTLGGGINIFNPHKKKFFQYSKLFNSTKPEHKVSSIYQDSKGNIWFTSEGSGMSYLKPNTSFHDEKVVVNCIKIHPYLKFIKEINIPNNKKGYLVGARNGLKTLNLENDNVETITKGLTMDCVQDDHGFVWVATYGAGLLRYDPFKRFPITYFNEENSNLTTDILRSVLLAKNGDLWIGSNRGLMRIKTNNLYKPNPKVKLYNHNPEDSNSISSNYILPVIEGKNGTIYVGTMGGGLNILTKAKKGGYKVTRITTDNGLPNNTIKSILEDRQGIIWITTNKGMCSLTPNGKIKKYGISDGLQGNEYSELAGTKLRDGRLVVGGVNGINVFRPKDIVEHKIEPKTIITELKVLNKSIKPDEKINGRILLSEAIEFTKSISLKHSENSFSIAFCPLHLAAPLNNVAKYRLKGFEKQWTEVNGNYANARYTNIPAGTYIFEVLSANGDGLWNTTPTTLTLKVKRHILLSYPLIAFYILAFMGAVWFFMKYSIIRNKKKQELIMEAFEIEKMQELSDMKLRFFTNISHEFKTPITLLLTPLEELIERTELPDFESYKRINSMMHRNAKMLLRLVNQLLDFRKYEQGKMILQVSNSDLISFLKSIHLKFEGLANKKEIGFNFDCSISELSIYFDADKLEKVLNNLLSNAFKYTKQGGVISLNVVKTDSSTIHISVKDNGVGIPLEKQEHIFERFYQAKQINQKQVGGTGIGLAFSKGLVEMMKGELSFVSNEQQGTEFTIVLPTSATLFSNEEKAEIGQNKTTDLTPLPTEAFINSDDFKGEQSNNTHSDLKVLLVEDNIELRKYIKGILKSDYSILEAENGSIGLELARRELPDIIVSDVMMPEMDGIEMCRIIKTEQETNHIPVILLTAKSSEENQITGLTSGADTYIPKPFNNKILKAHIKTIISNREKVRETFQKNFELYPSEIKPSNPKEEFLNKVVQFIEENIGNPEFAVPQLAQHCGINQASLTKKVQSLTGLRPKILIRSMRVKRAAQLFANSDLNISEITYEVGFNDLKHFRLCFRDEYGMSPSEYIKEHRKA